MLQKEFSSNFNWQSVRKFLFGIKKKFLTTYLNVFLSKSYNNHFSDIFYDIIRFKINLHNTKFKKIGKNVNDNSKFVLTFSNQVFNKILHHLYCSEEASLTTSSNSFYLYSQFSENRNISLQLLLISMFLKI